LRRAGQISGFPDGEPAELRHKMDVLHAHCAEIGRDPTEIEISVKAEADTEPEAFAMLTMAYRKAGAQHIIATSRRPTTPFSAALVSTSLQ
jgi:hypothetical protein